MGTERKYYLVRADALPEIFLRVMEAKELLDMLRKCKQGRLCPHGRPTMITITGRELEKRFLRR